MAERNGKEKTVVFNRRASHDYFLEDRYECGIQLTGTEIKSIRAGKVQFKDSYISIYKGEAWIKGMHISNYSYGNIFNVDPIRKRRLLVTKKEINKLIGLIKREGITLVPTELYLKGKWAKLTIGIGKGKKLYDKRQDIAKKSAQKEMAMRFKEKNQA